LKPRLNIQKDRYNGTLKSYKTVPSLRDSDQIYDLTQHSAFGCVLSCDIPCLRHSDFVPPTPPM